MKHCTICPKRSDDVGIPAGLTGPLRRMRLLHKDAFSQEMLSHIELRIREMAAREALLREQVKGVEALVIKAYTHGLANDEWRTLDEGLLGILDFIAKANRAS